MSIYLFYLWFKFYEALPKIGNHMEMKFPRMTDFRQPVVKISEQAIVWVPVV